MEITIPKNEVGLKREIGLISAVNFLINVIIGSGIFITPGKVLAECGSVGMMLVIWTVCGLVAFMTCLPFGELSSVVPKSGSIYIYLQSAFRGLHPFFGGLPAFVFFWLTYVVVQPCGTAINAKLFADYSYKIFQVFVCEDIMCHEGPVKLVLGASALVAIGAINCLSMRVYLKSQDVLTFTKMAAIYFTIGCGVYMYFSGKAKKFDVGFDGTTLTLHGFTQAMYFGLYAYDGGWAITGITEELKHPEKNILYSILITLTITTVTYLLLNITFLSALSPQEIAHGNTVIADFSERMFGVSGGVISSAIISISLLTSIMCGTLYNSRVGYVAAREGHIVEILCYIHKTRKTPIPAVAVQILLSLMYFLVGWEVTALIDMSSFFMWLAYGATMVSVFVFRHTLPDAPRPFKVPSVIPVLVAILSCGLVAVSLTLTPPILLVLFIVCVFASIVLYYIFIYKEYQMKNLDCVHKKLQDWLGLEPPDDLRVGLKSPLTNENNFNK